MYGPSEEQWRNSAASARIACGPDLIPSLSRRSQVAADPHTCRPAVDPLEGVAHRGGTTLVPWHSPATGTARSKRRTADGVATCSPRPLRCFDLAPCARAPIPHKRKRSRTGRAVLGLISEPE